MKAAGGILFPVQEEAYSRFLQAEWQIPFFEKI